MDGAATAKAGCTEPILATPTKWQYRAIYRIGDQRVGQWSAAASVIVGG